MLRRRLATATLAAATLLGGMGPAAAEAGPRSLEHPQLDRGPQSLSDRMPRALLDATAPRDTDRTDAAGPTSQARGPLGWSERIAARLHALGRDARVHAAERPAEAAASEDLLDRLETLATALEDDVAVGIAVRELSTGAPVFEWDAARRLNPASNHKLLTAAAALELLGADYRFDTTVRRHGNTLVLVGEGDPSLQVEDLAALADRVAASTDLNTVDTLIADDTVFSARRFGPGYDSDGPGVSYMAPSGALSLQFNTVEIRVRGAADGQPLDIEVSPPNAHVQIRSTATGGRGGLSIQTWADGDRTIVDVRGHLAAGSRVDKRRRINDPGRFTAAAFAAMLAERGASIASVQLGAAPHDAIEVAQHRSAPLPAVLESALAYSNNFTTEQLLRTLGWRMSGQPGDWENGRVALERYWAAAGLPAEDLRFENASGLSTQGRITAAALADLLAFASREGSAAAALWTALPIAGREGTLRGRLRTCGDRVRAKTGTLRGASALSGLVEDKQGRRLGFSILVNGPISVRRSHRLQDKLVTALAGC